MLLPAIVASGFPGKRVAAKRAGIRPTAVMAASYSIGILPAGMDAPPSGPHEPVVGPVVAVSSNKGGVGKTTLAANLAVYARALREDLPVLVVGLDDQRSLDRMFGLRPPQPGEP